jgi:8-oxo-dGTP pyrophosphatase MutT (NUDIX family)
VATLRRSAPIVRAAGGVVWRVRKGKIEVALVHRPRYDDWTLPKGKLDPGETELAAAVREVREELGSHVAVSRRITTVTYPVDSVRKRVTYWVMKHAGGEFVAHNEVDDAMWLRPKHARNALSYDIDREVLADFTAVPVPESVIVLVRHARAGKRSEWKGDDAERPLDDFGRDQAHRLVEFLSWFAPTRIVSANLARCTETVEPLAQSLGLSVAVDPVFSDAEFVANPSGTETALLSLAKPGKVTVICSQGEAVPGLIDRVVRGTRPSETRKGDAWVLSLVDGTVVSADYYDDASR